MSQKEVIHLTLGSIAHHVSTHFFNQQSSHFQYGDVGSSSSNPRDDDMLLDLNVDFQAGVGTRRNEETFFPREVVVSFKSDLGRGWDAYTAVAAEDGEGDAEDEDSYGEEVITTSNALLEAASAWSGSAELLRTNEGGKISRTRYQDDHDEDPLSDSDTDDVETSTVPTSPQSTQVVKDSSTKSGKSSLRQRIGVHSYRHNLHHPRSILPLPRLFASGTLMSMGNRDEAEGALEFASFERGLLLAREMEKDSAFSEESIRWFAENSDSLQSYNLTTATSDGFSGFSHDVLQMLTDEYPKTPIVAWGVQWGRSNGATEGPEQKLERLRKTNNVLSLWSLSSASLYVPLEMPARLLANVQDGRTRHFSSRSDWNDEYQAAALFSAHIDTATLRMRLRDPNQHYSAASMVASLNWRRDTPIARLGGCLPTPLLAPMAAKNAPIDPIEALLASRGYGSRDRGRRDNARFDTPQERAQKAAEQLKSHFIDLSGHQSSKQGRGSSSFAQSITARDDDALAEGPTRDALETWNQLDEPVGQSSFVRLPYNIQRASFPQMFRKLTSTGRPVPEDYQSSRARVQSVPMVSALSTSSATAETLRQAYNYLDTKIIRGHDPLQTFGLGGARGGSAGQAANEESEGPLGGRDGMMEIRERLEELLGAYEGDQGAAVDRDADEGMGTDEEYEEQVDEWDIDI